jgi:hypothetical protein
MEIDSGMVTTIGGAIAATGASIAAGVKVLADKIGSRFERLELKWEECNIKHIEDRELIGGLRAELQGVKSMVETLKQKPDGSR